MKTYLLKSISIAITLTLVSLSAHAAPPTCPWGTDFQPNLASYSSTLASTGLTLVNGNIFMASCIGTEDNLLEGRQLEAFGTSTTDYFLLTYRGGVGVPVQVRETLTPAQIHICASEVRRLCSSAGFEYKITTGNGPE